MALSHSRDACLAQGGKCVLFFDSAKQETELEQLRKEERLVKVACPSSVLRLFLLFLCVSLPFLDGIGYSWSCVCSFVDCHDAVSGWLCSPIVKTFASSNSTWDCLSIFCL